MCFGNLIRPANKERIDFRTSSGLISGECKDYDQPLCLNSIKSILLRVPDESELHLVVTNIIQSRYFTKEETFETFLHENQLPGFDIYRCADGSALKEIDGMKTEEAHKVHVIDHGSTIYRRKKLVISIELDFPNSGL